MCPVVKSWDGFLWDIREPPVFHHDKMVLTKREHSVLKTLISLGSKEKVFVEVGVHVGYYAIRLAGLYKEVDAVEPHVRNLEGLRKNISLNNIQNIVVLPYAAGQVDEDKLLYDFGSSSTFYRRPTPHTMMVKVRRLDTLINHVDVMKIDTEGWEEPILRGSVQLLRKCKPVIVIEHHDTLEYPEVKGAFQRICAFLFEYYHINLDGTRYVHIHRDVFPKLPEHSIRMMVTYHWFNRMCSNLENKRPWYIGLPYQWWYGMGMIDVLEELPSHVLEEPEWINILRG